MNYLDLYNKLVYSRQARGLNKNKLNFYTEKHHIVLRSMGGSNKKENLVLLTLREHFLAHKLLWKSNKSCKQYQRAYWIMSNSYKTTSREFEKARIVASTANKGEGNPFFGKKHTEEAKLKTGAASKGRKQSPESIERTRMANLGAKRSETARKNMSKAARNKNLAPWETSKVVARPYLTLLWKNAQVFYEVWINSDKLGERRFTKLYNELYCDEVPRSSIFTILKKFKEDWIPCQDSKWVKFNEG